MPGHYRPHIVIMELLDYKNLRGLNLEGRTPMEGSNRMPCFCKVCVGVGRGISCCCGFKEESTGQKTTVVDENPQTTINRKEK